MTDNTNPQPAEPRIWIGTLIWRARAALLIFVLAAAALTLPAQVQDMLANLADFDDLSLESWLHALGFHGAMILMALGLWFWARAVLLAAFRLPDTLDGRDLFAGMLSASSQAERGWTLWGFDLLPRIIGLGIAVVAAIAVARSGKWLQTAIAIGWGLGLYCLLKYRLVIELRLGLGQSGETGPERPPGRSFFTRLWQRLLELLDYAPLGRWIAAWTLALAAGLFVLSALTAFIPHGIEVKTYLAHLLPGPSVALFLLGMAVAPLTALTYCIDRATRLFMLGGKEIQLRFVPVLIPLLILMGIGAVFMNLHALRVVDDPNAMPPDNRGSLALLFKAWAETCAPGKGPVQPILVAVSGGASRAGLWAARVLDVVDDSVRRSGSKSASVFAVSSVSGGSLGAAAYVAMRAGQSVDPAKRAPACSLAALAAAQREARDVAETEAMRADAIGPALAGMMLGDAPRSLAAYAAWPVQEIYGKFFRPEKYRDSIALLRGNDRAEALEAAFEHNWQVDGIDPIAKVEATPVGFEKPYLSLFYGAGNTPRGDVPLWITNGTDVNTGDRLITVPFKVNGESFCRGKDAGAALGTWYPSEGPLPASASAAARAARMAAKKACGASAAFFWYQTGPFLAARDVLALLKSDIPISTAIDNTSRFPFLSPSGELTPTQDPRPGEPAPPQDAQIIDGGYFENEGIMSAMEVADWLRAYGPGLIGRPVYPIVVQATSDADSGKLERDIARCGNRLPLNPNVADAAPRSSQFLVPLSGLTAVRSGHSRALLQQALRNYCDEGGQQAFFHFYLYNAPDFDIPLNWSLSEKVADFIWNDAIEVCGNKADRSNLIATLRLGADAWKAPAAQTNRAGRTIQTCAGPADDLKVVTAKLADLPSLKMDVP